MSVASALDVARAISCYGVPAFQAAPHWFEHDSATGLTPSREPAFKRAITEQFCA